MAQIQGLKSTLLLDRHHPSLLQASMVWADHRLFAADYQGRAGAGLLELPLKLAF